MTVTFCGHSKLYNQSGDFSKWLDLILPSLIEGGVAKTLDYARRKQEVIVQYPRREQQL